MSPYLSEWRCIFQPGLLRKFRMKQSCNHIGLLTENPGALVRFYTETLGFVEGETREIPQYLMEQVFGLPSACLMTKLHLGDIVLEIFSAKENKVMPKPAQSKGYNHWGLKVENKERFAEEARQKGADVLEVPYKGRKVFFIKDPEGNLIEIFNY